MPKSQSPRHGSEGEMLRDIDPRLLRSSSTAGRGSSPTHPRNTRSAHTRGAAAAAPRPPSSQDPVSSFSPSPTAAQSPAPSASVTPVVRRTRSNYTVTPPADPVLTHSASPKPPSRSPSPRGTPPGPATAPPVNAATPTTLVTPVARRPPPASSSTATPKSRPTGTRFVPVPSDTPPSQSPPAPTSHTSVGSSSPEDPSSFAHLNDSWEGNEEINKILFQEEPWRPASEASNRGSFVPVTPPQTTPATTARTANRFSALALHDTAAMHGADPVTAAPATVAAVPNAAPKPAPAGTLASTAPVSAAPSAAPQPSPKLRSRGSGAGRGHKHCPACNNTMGARQRTCPKCQFDTLANQPAVKPKPAAKPNVANRPSKYFPGLGYKFCVACQCKMPARSIVCPCGHHTRSNPSGAGPSSGPTPNKGKGKKKTRTRSRSRSKSHSPGVTSTTWGPRTVAKQRAAQKNLSSSAFQRTDFMIPAIVPVPANLAPAQPPAGPAPVIVDYPANALVSEDKALDHHVASVAVFLARDSSGIVGALPALPLTAPDTRLPTDSAAYHSLVLSSIDPLARDMPAATHVQQHFAPLCQHEPDPHVQLCADMLAGLRPELALMLTPRVGCGHQQNTHVQVCDALREANKKAVEHFDKGDDRLLSLVWCFLPLALLMHDPRGAPRLDKHVPAYNRRCTLHRVKAIRRHGYSAIAALLLDWRAIAALRALEPSPDIEIDPATKISIVSGLLARGVPLGACLERVNSSRTTASDTDTIAIQFGLQDSPDASEGDPDLPAPGSFDPATLPASELRKMLPTGTACPSPFTLPNQFDEETVNGYTHDDIQQAMCQTLRSVDGGASAFVDGTTPSSQKLFLTHVDGWLTCFGLVRAIDSDNMRSICHRNNSDPHTNLHTGLFISLCKRTRARLIPKNHKPGYRILQIASLALSIHAGFITTITKPKTRSATAYFSCPARAVELTPP